jgi:hypothetical protein
MTYPPEYLAAVRFTLGPNIEGGYVFDPTDAGGETHMGITDKSDGKIDRMIDLDHDGNGDVSVKDLKREQALEYYFRWYWSGLCDGLEPLLAALLFDCSVNHGYARAKGWKAANPSVQALLKTREDFYHSCVANRPANKKYINGWLNRIDWFCKAFNIKYKTKR